MTVTYPYPLSWLSDVLRISEATMRIERQEETSGAGTGQYWAAELADPLWTAVVPLSARSSDEARSIDAALNMLGSNKVMLFADPSYEGIDASGVTLSAFNADRTAITLSGLASGQVVKRGQRLSVAYGANVWFAEFGENVMANESGVLGAVSIYPYPPMTLTVGVEVELAKPFLKMMIADRSAFTHQPGAFGQGATLTLRQKP
ncbi:hypothetical protein [Thioclava kandeliae]|uniref:Uncharacterized protein n=1 Tax=Thioclava kandeliae TaxID=3070818 RepID=A0ABV1SFA6_9RHOB